MEGETIFISRGPLLCSPTSFLEANTINQECASPVSEFRECDIWAYHSHKAGLPQHQLPKAIPSAQAVTKRPCAQTNQARTPQEQQCPPNLAPPTCPHRAPTGIPRAPASTAQKALPTSSHPPSEEVHVIPPQMGSLGSLHQHLPGRTWYKQSPCLLPLFKRLGRHRPHVA